MPSPPPTPSLLPLSFYAFLPAKDPLSLSGCRWVPSAGRYQCLYAGQGWGMDEFCKSPFSSLLFSFPRLFCRVFPSPSPSRASERPALVAASPGARRAFKRETGGRFLFHAAFWPGPRGARLCARCSSGWMTREEGCGMSTGSPSLSLALSRGKSSSHGQSRIG